MRRVLVLTDDRLGPAMAGPALRALELARVLAQDASVTLASTRPVGPVPDAPCDIVHAPAPAKPARHHDVLVAPGLLPGAHPALLALDQPLVLDLVAPCLLEDLARGLGPAAIAGHRARLDAGMARADFMLCAGERQRDHYLGRLCALQRLAPAAHAEDPAFTRLIADVPFGLPATPPAAGPARLPPGQVRFLWAGGLWDWLDPLTPLRGLARADLPEAHLIYLAGASPNPGTPRPAMPARTRALVAELDLHERVHVLDAWVPYAERGAVALEADAAFMAHPATLESHFAFRTRALDALWAGRPVLCTRGDALAELVEREGLGLAVPPGDADAWAAAFTTIARDDAFVAACRARIAALRPTLTWERVAEPLQAFVAGPTRSPSSHVRIPARHRLALARELWQHEGAHGLWRVISARAR